MTGQGNWNTMGRSEIGALTRSELGTFHEKPISSIEASSDALRVFHRSPRFPKSRPSRGSSWKTHGRFPKDHDAVGPPSARNRRFWRKTAISRFLENGENANRLKLRNGKSKRKRCTRRGLRTAADGRVRTPPLALLQAPQARLAPQLDPDQLASLQAAATTTLDLVASRKTCARSTPRRSSPSSPPWRPSTGLTAQPCRCPTHLPSTRRRRSRRPRPGSRPSPRSQRSAGR